MTTLSVSRRDYFNSLSDLSANTGDPKPKRLERRFHGHAPTLHFFVMVAVRTGCQACRIYTSKPDSCGSVICTKSAPPSRQTSKQQDVVSNGNTIRLACFRTIRSPRGRRPSPGQRRTTASILRLGSHFQAEPRTYRCSSTGCQQCRFPFRSSVSRY